MEDERLPVYTDDVEPRYVGRYRFPVRPDVPVVRMKFMDKPPAFEPPDPDAIVEPLAIHEVRLRRCTLSAGKRDTGQVESIFRMEVDALMCDPADAERLADSADVVDRHAEDPVRRAFRDYDARLLDLRLVAVGAAV